MPSAASGPLLRGARRLLGVLQSFVGFGSWISGDVGLASVFCWVRGLARSLNRDREGSIDASM